MMLFKGGYMEMQGKYDQDYYNFGEMLKARLDPQRIEELKSSCF